MSLVSYKEMKNNFTLFDFSTRVRSLELLDRSGKRRTQFWSVYHFVERNEGCTRDEISKGLGLRLSSVCGRIGDLKREGLVIERADFKRNNETGMPNSRLYIGG